MSRYRVMAGLVLLASCASAGDGADQAPTDARRAGDAPVVVDTPVDMCPSAATCQAATPLGTVSGDTQNQRLTATGFQSAWFQVRVTEDYSGAGGVKLRVAARLTSPAAVDHDVFVYVNTGRDLVECATAVGTPTTSGTVDEVRIQWGEGTFGNSSSDDRTVSIEVRPVSGACAPSQMWQLEVEGNWN